jgi:hypothetical protein
VNRPWRRLAASGSTGWPKNEVWEQQVINPIWDYIDRMPDNGVLYIRHGNADGGVDNIVHRWIQTVLAIRASSPATATMPSLRRSDVEIIEELAPADWSSCNPHCKDVKADGSPHRRPNPGWPDTPRRGALEDYCPSAGHWRNPEVVGFTYSGPPNRHERKHYQPIPDARVSLLMAWNYNNSPGTTATVRHAAAMGVPHRTWNAYG